uniref:AP2/ERF domain-containing protein n=1 Tax=Macrostomum lignano TaxID=282301 RepID=A0A1I8GUH7_9PLAT
WWQRWDSKTYQATSRRYRGKYKQPLHISANGKKFALSVRAECIRRVYPRPRVVVDHEEQDSERSEFYGYLAIKQPRLDCETAESEDRQDATAAETAESEDRQDATAAETAESEDRQDATAAETAESEDRQDATAAETAE